MYLFEIIKKILPHGMAWPLLKLKCELKREDISFRLPVLTVEKAKATRLLPSSGFRIPEFRRIGNSPESASGGQVAGRPTAPKRWDHNKIPRYQYVNGLYAM